MSDMKTNPKTGRYVLIPIAVLAFILYKNFGDDEPNRVILHDEIKSGNIALDVNGTGEINGPIIKGYLINKTAQAKKINVTLVKPLYLLNSDRSAQNMVATRVYRYDAANGKRFRYIDDDIEYIKLRENEHLPIVFIAYCADFDKDAPDAFDSFTIGTLPSGFSQITDNIKQFRADNEDADVIDGAQIALWKSQGIGISSMRQVLDISKNDRDIARRLL